MSAGQRQTIDAILRQNAYPVDSDVSELRRRTKEQASAQPLPADVTVTAGELGGVPTAEITVHGVEPRNVVPDVRGMRLNVICDVFCRAAAPECSW